MSVDTDVDVGAEAIHDQVSCRLLLWLLVVDARQAESHERGCRVYLDGLNAGEWRE